jgi:hypothetical protein
MITFPFYSTIHDPAVELTPVRDIKIDHTIGIHMSLLFEITHLHSWFLYAATSSFMRVITKQHSFETYL